MIMTAPYKKRAKAGYNNDKSVSNRAERTYEPKDIKDHLETESKTRAAVKSKAPKVDGKILSDITNLKWALKSSQGNGLESLKTKWKDDSFFSSHYNRLYRDATASIPYLRKALETDIPSKIKKQIRELLAQLPE